MPTVKWLMQQANPVPNDVVHDPAGVEDRLAGRLDLGAATKAGTVRARRRLIAVVAVAVVIAVAGGVGVALLQDSPQQQLADEPFYATTGELEGQADAIVRGVVVRTRNVASDAGTETAASFKVTNVAKGDVPIGTALQVRYTPVGSGPETPEALHRGGEYVLLLEHRDPVDWNLVSSIQGYYTVKSGSLTPTSDNQVPLNTETKQALGIP